MPRYRITAPDGRTFDVTAPDGATQEDALAYAQSQWKPDPTSAALSQAFDNSGEQPKPQPQADNSLTRQLGLTVRAGANAIGAIPNAIADPLVRGANALGANLSIPSEAYERLLDRALPRPANDTERFANTVASGMAQPAGMASLIERGAPRLAQSAPQLIDRIGTQIASAGGGAAGAEVAKQNDFGTFGQIAAPLAGVMLPTAGLALTTGARAAGGVAKSAVAPFTQEGRKDIAARALQRSATDADAAANSIGTAPRYVPGVNPTTAELAGDTGVSSLYKTLRNQNPASFSDVEAANDAARQAALARSFGTPADLQMAQAARNDVTTPLRDAAFANAKAVNTKPIVTTADRILDSGAGKRQEVEKAMNWVKSRLDGENNPQRIYAVRQDIDDIISGKLAGDPEKASLQLAAKELNAVKSVLDSQLEKSAPGFKNYLSQYADRSRTIDALATGQDISARALNPMTERLSPAAFARQVNSRPEDVANMGAIGSDVIMRMNEDLKRSVAPMNAMRTSGSDTLQNMVGNDMLQRAIGHLPGGVTTRVAAKLASLLYSPAEQQTRGLLVQSMIDPKLGEELLRRQMARRPDLLGGLLAARYPVAQGGLLGAISAQ